MHFILQAISNISSTAYYKCSDVGSIIQNKIQVSIWIKNKLVSYNNVGG